MWHCTPRAKLVLLGELCFPCFVFYLFLSGMKALMSQVDDVDISIKCKEFMYSSKEELLGRPFRFPSVEDRIKVYMSTWYAPPCKNNADGYLQYRFIDNVDPSETSKQLLIRELPGKTRGRGQSTFLLNKYVERATLFYLDRDEIDKCRRDRKMFLYYCEDTAEYLLPALDRVGGRNDAMAPIILQFGDAAASRARLSETMQPGFYPFIAQIQKFRFSFDNNTLAALTSKTCVDGPRPLFKSAGGSSNKMIRPQPIIWKLTYHRHFGDLDLVVQKDRPWSEKINMAIYRGAATGLFREGRNRKEYMQLSDKGKCFAARRCRLVYNSAHSKLINASLAGEIERNYFPKTIGNIQLFGEYLSKEELLKYKAIIMLEGNDVSSGLKWALLSNSVVMTQPPHFTSWAMEELLEPWVHYIPLNEDLSDVEEKMQWVIDNDKEAQLIAQRGSLWIKDLVYHPDAERDNLKIFDETLRRYQAHFQHNPRLSKG